VLLFDQDSTADPRLVDNLIRVCAVVGEQGLDRLGVLGSNHIDQNTGEPYEPSTERDEGWVIERKTVITSGSLLSVSAFDAIGPFREEFFIDGVDHEYCLRARAKGYRVLLALAPLLLHAMGNRRTERPLPGIAVQTVNYTPFRWYFIVKNRLTLVREYARSEPAWAAARAGRLVTQLATTLALEPGRVEKARCMGLGALDFATGRKARKPGEI
jgi:rhamnosyltransferase